MDTRLALTGTPVNFLASIGAGQDLAARQAQMGRTAQEWGLYRQHGEGIASGDQNAINALARFDPTAALGVRQTHQSMSHAEERMSLARAAAARAAQSHAASLSAAERAEEGQRLGRAVATLIGPLRAGDLETVNQGLRTLGITDGPLASLDDAAILMAGVETALPYFEAGQAMLGGGEPEITTAMQTLTQRAAAAGLQPGTAEYQNFMLQGGRPEEGLRFTQSPDGTVTLAQGAGLTAETPAGRPALDGASAALEDIGRAVDIVTDNPAFTTGFVGSIMRGVPGSEAFDLGQLTTTIGANITFETLNQMRQASSTGASGLGQVTQTEIALLMATLGSIEQAQSQEQLLRNLQRLETQFNQVVHGHPEGEAAARTALERGWPLFGAVVDGFRYNGGDPSQESSWEPVR